MKNTNLRAGVAAFALLAAQHAFAHAQLSSSMPADEAVIDVAPKEVTLHFSEPVRLTALTVGAQGETPRELGPLPGGMSADFAVTMPALEDGRYVVSWRALSADTHVLTGEISFAVTSGSAAAADPSEHSPAR